MIIGEPMSGKTKAYNILAETLTTLAEMKIPEQHEFKVRFDVEVAMQMGFSRQGWLKQENGYQSLLYF